jgi:hypothetical protein
VRYVDRIDVCLAIAERKGWPSELCGKVGGVVCIRVGIGGGLRNAVKDIGGVEMGTNQCGKLDHTISIFLRSLESVLAPHVCAEVRKRTKTGDGE